MTEPDPQLGTVYTTYTYNLLDKLTQVQLPRAQHGTTTYDQNGQGGRLLTAVNPENGTVTYTYNGDGTLATRRDNKGQTTQYSYGDVPGPPGPRGLHGAARRSSTFTYTYQYTAAGLVTSESMALKLGPYPDGYQGFYINAPR